jgi:recombination protein RecT
MNTALVVRDEARLIVDDIAEDLRLALPANIPLDRFKATFITAAAHNPDIMLCDAQSVKTALMKAAADNLLPDNREAAIVPYNTKVKDADGRERWIKAAQYMPMVLGIRKRAKELGGIKSIVAECVYANDEFEVIAGDDPRIIHKPTKMGQPRGDIIGAYAIFKDDKDEILHREVMPKEDIEKARSVSRAKDGPGWTKFFGEFARKTVVRRGAKSVPSMPEKLRTVIERDDDYIDLEAITAPARDPNYNPLLAPKVTPVLTHEPTAAAAASEVAHEGLTERSSQNHERLEQSEDHLGANAGLGNQPGVTSAAGEQAATHSDVRQATPSTTNGQAASAQERVNGAASATPAGAASNPPDAGLATLLREYSAALTRATQPKSIPTAADQFWKQDGKTKPADKAAQAKFAAVMALHTKRCTKEIDLEKCKQLVEGVITS